MSLQAERDAARHKLINAGLILAHQGHGDMTRGHVSIRVPGEPGHFYMKAHSIGLDEITMENILTFDLEGEVVEGSARPHSERYIHSEIFRARPDVHSVIHAHPTHAVAFSVTGQAMRAMSQGGAIFKDHLPVFTGTIDLIRSKQTGADVARALGDAPCVLMRAHGIALAAESVEAAVVLSVMLEEAAKVQLLATAAGADAWEFPAEDVEALRLKLMRSEQFVINFNYLTRLARRGLHA